jgi:hypothetical protein
VRLAAATVSAAPVEGRGALTLGAGGLEGVDFGAGSVEMLRWRGRRCCS